MNPLKKFKEEKKEYENRVQSGETIKIETLKVKSRIF